MRFDDLVSRHAAALFRYAFWLGRNREQAEDVVQEALLRAWRGFPRLRDQAVAKSWLYSIVRNEHYRMIGRNPPLAEVIDIDSIAAPEEPSTLSGLDMRDALMTLPSSYAEPLALQVLGGFSCAEIADMIGTTEGATMTRLTRARQALKRLVAPEEPAQRQKGQP